MSDARIGVERLGAFSDGVIAVLITIMVLELKAPEEASFAALLPLWHTVISYVVSYLFIAIIWINHHHLLHLVRQATPRLIWINFAHLFMVSLLPFTTAWIARTRLEPAPVTVYACVFVLVDLAYAVFERAVLAEADDSRINDRAKRRARRRTYLSLGIFGTAAIVAPWVPLLGFALICCSLVLYMRPELISAGAGAPLS